MYYMQISLFKETNYKTRIFKCKESICKSAIENKLPYKSLTLSFNIVDISYRVLIQIRRNIIFII